MSMVTEYVYVSFVYVCVCVCVCFTEERMFLNNISSLKLKDDEF